MSYYLQQLVLVEGTGQLAVGCLFRSLPFPFSLSPFAIVNLYGVLVAGDAAGCTVLLDATFNATQFLAPLYKLFNI